MLTSLLDVASSFVTLEVLPSDSPALGALRVLRLLRVFRIFRLVRSWSGLRELLSALLASFTQFVYLMLLLTLFLFIYALLGMQVRTRVGPHPPKAPVPATRSSLHAGSACPK